MTTTTTETPEEALARIQAMGFGKNDALVIMAFADRGIDPESIDPRHNVLTFRAWKASGRQVAKGAISVRVTVWIPKRGKAKESTEGDDKKQSGGMYPKTTALFHESQTIPLGSPKGTRPESWNNPQLVKPGTYEAPQEAIDNREPWTEKTTVEQAEAEMTAVLGGHEQPQGPFSGPTVGELLPDDRAAVGEDFGAHGDDRPQECNCPMVGVITNVDCPLHGTR